MGTRGSHYFYIYTYKITQYSRGKGTNSNEEGHQFRIKYCAFCPLCQSPDSSYWPASQCVDCGIGCGVGCSQSVREKDTERVMGESRHWRKMCEVTEQHSPVLQLLLITQFPFTPYYALRWSVIAIASDISSTASVHGTTCLQFGLPIKLSGSLYFSEGE